MSIDVQEYIDVEERASALGITKPEGFCILPRHFEDGKTQSDFRHESSALDVKALLRQAKIPIALYKPDGADIPVLQENDNTWVGPIIFVTAAALSSNPDILAVALGVIANYVTELFRGSPEPSRARITVVVETSKTKTTKKTTKRINFDGPPEEIKEIKKIIKDMKDLR